MATKGWFEADDDIYTPTDVKLEIEDEEITTKESYEDEDFEEDNIITKKRPRVIKGLDTYDSDLDGGGSHYSFTPLIIVFSLLAVLITSWVVGGYIIEIVNFETSIPITVSSDNASIDVFAELNGVLSWGVPFIIFGVGILVFFMFGRLFRY